MASRLVLPRRRRLAALLAPALLLGAVTPAAPAAAQATTPPTATVTPATDLADGQPVAVTLTGFPPAATIRLSRCGSASGSTQGEVCDYVPNVIGEADAQGRLALTVPAERRLSTRGLSWDCAAGPWCRWTFSVDDPAAPRATVPVSFRRVGPLRMFLEQAQLVQPPFVTTGAACTQQGALASAPDEAVVVCAPAPGAPALRWRPASGWRNPAVATLGRIYATLLLRPLDAAALSTWVPALARTSLGGVAAAIAASAEFRAKEGTPTDEQFVGVVYRNAFGRAPDAAGLAHWLGVLRAGGRGAVAAGVADSAEARALYRP